MNAQHFKELINSVCKTTNLPKYKVASFMGIAIQTINKWECEGVPVRIKPYVMSVLRKVLFAKKSELHKIK
jgi:DNA-binding XRE family transcriptional regulator